MSIVGKATQTTRTHSFLLVCIWGSGSGRADDGWVEILVVVRCLRANIVDKVRTNLGKNKLGYDFTLDLGHDILPADGALSGTVNTKNSWNKSSDLVRKLSWRAERVIKWSRMSSI